MSQLSDKILSYPVESYFPMNSAVNLNSGILGTFLPTGTPYFNTSGVVPVYDSTSNPIGAGTDGSWLFDQSVINQQGKHIRTHNTTYSNQKVWDGFYGFGIWLKLNSIPTGTSTGTYTLYSTARSNAFPGFAITIRGTAHTSGSGIMHNLFSSTTPIVSNPVVGQWYYIVGRKNRSTSGASIWVNGVRVALGSNTTGVEPVTSAETPYQIIFGDNSTRTAANAFSYNLSHAHLMNFADFTDSVISQIYTAGSTAPATYALKYWNGTAWTTPLSITQWNGTSWTTFNGKVWTGSTWQNIVT